MSRIDEIRERLEKAASEFVDLSESDCCGTSDILFAEERAFKAGAKWAKNILLAELARLDNLLNETVDKYSKCADKYSAVVDMLEVAVKTIEFYGQDVQPLDCGKRARETLSKLKSMRESE